MSTTLRRLTVLWSVTSFNEFLIILYHQFLTGRLSVIRPELHRLLLFVVGCVKRDIRMDWQGELLLLHWKEAGREVTFSVRKYSRDLFVFADFFLERDYDKFCVLLENRVDNMRFIVDAGANIGCSAIFYKCRFPEAKIVCIEPESSNFDLLNHNIQVNQMQDQIVSLKKALWTEKTSLDLMQRDWSHDGFLVMTSERQDEVIDQVETVTVAEIQEIFKSGHIDLLKIDIEGAEKEFFSKKEYTSSLCDHTNAIFMEVHPEFIPESEVVRSLSLMQFRCEPIHITGQPVSICATRILQLI
ncbi:MAG: FkbM family methyltransferase [Chitinophagaceae bacterium]